MDFLGSVAGLQGILFQVAVTIFGGFSIFVLNTTAIKLLYDFKDAYGKRSPIDYAHSDILRLYWLSCFCCKSCRTKQDSKWQKIIEKGTEDYLNDFFNYRIIHYRLDD